MDAFTVTTPVTPSGQECEFVPQLQFQLQVKNKIRPLFQEGLHAPQNVQEKEIVEWRMKQKVRAHKTDTSCFYCLNIIYYYILV